LAVSAGKQRNLAGWVAERSTRQAGSQPSKKTPRKRKRR
jgi:hypothetical protein